MKSDELSCAMYCDDNIADFYSIISGMIVDLQPGCHAVYRKWHNFFRPIQMSGMNL